MNKKKVTGRNWLLSIASSLVILSLFSCGGGGNKSANTGISKESCIDSIKSIEAKLKTIQSPDAFTYNRAINAYMQFVNNFPNDTMAPVCLFDAANIAMSLTQYQRAINIYDTITIKYPAFKERPIAFLYAGLFTTIS